jgi:hypothetical protein
MVYANRPIARIRTLKNQFPAWPDRKSSIPASGCPTAGSVFLEFVGFIKNVLPRSLRLSKSTPHITNSLEYEDRIKEEAVIRQCTKELTIAQLTFQGGLARFLLIDVDHFEQVERTGHDRGKRLRPALVRIKCTLYSKFVRERVSQDIYRHSHPLLLSGLGFI